MVNVKRYSADGEWRLKTNKELENAIGYENIVRHIKSRRLSWLGLVEKMTNERVPKIIYKWKPYSTRPKGRPRLRWEDDVRNDLESMGVKNWKVIIDRDFAPDRKVLPHTRPNNCEFKPQTSIQNTPSPSQRNKYRH